MRLPALTALALAGSLAIAATPAPTVVQSEEGGGTTVSTLEPDQTQFNLRRSDCGGDSDRLYLSVKAGTDAGDGCGSLGGIVPLVNEATITAEDSRIYVDKFPADDGLPLIVDAARDVTGTVTFAQYSGVSGNPVTPGAGEMKLELKLSGYDAAWNGFTVTTVATATALPASGEYTVDFTFDLPDDAQEIEIEDLTLEMVKRGTNVNQDFLRTSDGASNFVFPTLVEVDETAGA